MVTFTMQKEMDNHLPDGGQVAGVLWDPEQQLGELASPSSGQKMVNPMIYQNSWPWLPSTLATQALLQPTGNPVESNGPFSWEGPGNADSNIVIIIKGKSRVTAHS